MKMYWLLLTASIVALGASVPADPTNAPARAKSPAEQEVGISAKHLLYHDNILVYFGDVVVTNGQGKLCCERLTIDVPPEGSLDRQPTNVMAETNVVVDLVKKGDTNHVTCDLAVYTYHVLNGITNDTITFLGSSNRPAKVENSKGWMTGEPLIWDNVNGNFSGVNTETHFRLPAQAGAGTNPPAEAAPLDFLK